MTQRSNDQNPFDPFGALQTLRDANLDAFAKAMVQLVNTESYSQATGQMLDTYLTTSAPFRRVLESSMTQVLTQFNMPTRSDVISLAERLTNIEMRLDDLDARFDALERQVTQPRASRRSGKSDDAAEER